MIIRPANLWDADRISAMWHDMYGEIATNSKVLLEYGDKERLFLNIVARVKHPDWIVLVAEEKPDLVGFMMGQATYPRYSSCHILGVVEALYIMPSFRGQKIFAKLIEKAFEWAGTKNISEIEFMSMANSRVQKLYDRLGYEPTMIVYRKKEVI